MFRGKPYRRRVKDVSNDTVVCSVIALRGHRETAAPYQIFSSWRHVMITSPIGDHSSVALRRVVRGRQPTVDGKRQSRPPLLLICSTIFVIWTSSGRRKAAKLSSKPKVSSPIHCPCAAIVVIVIVRPTLETPEYRLPTS